MPLLQEAPPPRRPGPHPQRPGLPGSPELRPTPTWPIFHQSSAPALASVGFPGRWVLTRRPRGRPQQAPPGLEVGHPLPSVLAAPHRRGHCPEVPRAGPTASRTAQRPGAGRAQARARSRPASGDPPGGRQRPTTSPGAAEGREPVSAPSLSPRPALPAGRSCPACGERPVVRPARGLRVPAPGGCTPELSPSSETDELSVSSSSELLPSFSA